MGKGLYDIQIYQESLLLCKKIYTITQSAHLKYDYSLKDQLKRAGLSVPANIAEGYGRKSRKDFAHFLSISLGSANEVICYLDFIELQYRMDVSTLKKEYDGVGKRIYTFRTHLLKPHIP